VEKIQENPLANLDRGVGEIDAQRLLFTLRPLDSVRLLAMLAHNKKAENSVKDKKVVLMIGHTGAGKSTLTQYFGGSLLEEVTHGSKVRVNVRCYGSIPTLEKFEIGDCEVASKTRYVTGLPLSPSAVNGDLPNRSTETISLCDTPGFLETRGPEMQIATGQGIVDAVKKAKCVWPVIVIGRDSVGPKWHIFRDLLKTIAAFIEKIPSLIQNGGFTYIFTREWKEDDKQHIYDCISLLIGELTQDERANAGLVALLTDIQTQTFIGVGGWNRAHILNAATTKVKPGDLLQSIISRNPILDCKSSFSYMYSDESQKVINNQIRVQHQILHSASSPETFNFQLLEHHLNLGKYLSEQLKNESYKVAQANFSNIVQVNFQNYADRARETFCSSLLSYDRWPSDRSEEVEIFEKTVGSFDSALNDLEDAKDHLYTFLGRGFPDPSVQVEKVETLLTELVLNVLRSEGATFSIKGLPFGTLRSRFDRLLVASRCTVQSSILNDNTLFLNCYTDAKEILLNRYNATVELVRREISGWKMNEALENLDDLKEIELLLSVHLPQMNSYSNCLTFFKDTVSKKSMELDNYWNDKDGLDPSRLSLIEDIAVHLQIFERSKGLKKHSLADHVAECTKSFLDHVEEFAKRLCLEIKLAIQGNSEIGINGVKSKYDQLTSLKQFHSLICFKDIGKIILDCDMNAQKSFGELLLKVSTDMEKYLPLIREFATTRESNQQLAVTLKFLTDADWIVSLRPGEFANIKKVKRDIAFAYEALKQEIEVLELNVSTKEHIARVTLLKNQIDYSGPILLQINDQNKEVENIIKDARLKLTAKRKSVLENISRIYTAYETSDGAPKKFLLNCLNVAQVVQIQDYLSTCMKNGQTECEEAEILKKFNAFLSEYIGWLDAQLHIHFSAIEKYDPDNNDSREDVVEISAFSFEQILTEVYSFAQKGLDENRLHYWCSNHATGLLKNIFNLNQRRVNNTDMKSVLINANICTYLSRVDHFIKSSPKYHELRVQYFESLVGLAESCNQEISTAIAQDDFAEVVLIFRSLEEVNDEVTQGKIRRARRDLSKRVLNLKALVEKQSRVLSKEITTNVVEQLKENLEKLRSAETYVCSKYVDSEVAKSINEEFYVQIATVLSNFIVNHKQIQPYLKNNLLDQAEINIRDVSIMLDHMKDMELMTISGSVSGSHVDLDRIKIVEDLTDQLTNRLAQLEKFYKEQPVTIYPLNPPVAVFRALDKMIDTVLAKKTRDNITVAIDLKMRAEIDALSSNNALSGKEKVFKFNELEIALPTCPTILHDTYKLLISQARSKIEGTSKEFMSRVHKALNDPAPKGLVDLYQEASEKRHQEAIDYLEKGIKDDIISTADLIHSSMKNPDTLNEIHNAWKRLKEYEKFADRIVTIFPSFRNELLRTANEISESLGLLLEEGTEISQNQQHHSPGHKARKSHLTAAEIKLVFDFLMNFDNEDLLLSKENNRLKDALAFHLFETVRNLEKGKSIVYETLKARANSYLIAVYQWLEGREHFNQVLRDFGQHIATVMNSLVEDPVSTSTTPEANTPVANLTPGKRRNHPQQSHQNKRPLNQPGTDPNMLLIERGALAATSFSLEQAQLAIFASLEEYSVLCDAAIEKVVDKTGNSNLRNTLYKEINNNLFFINSMVEAFETKRAPIGSDSANASPMNSEWLETPENPSSPSHNPDTASSCDWKKVGKRSVGIIEKIVSLLKLFEDDLNEALQKQPVTPAIKDKFTVAFDHLRAIVNEFTFLPELIEKAKLVRARIASQVIKCVETTETQIKDCIERIQSPIPSRAINIPDEIMNLAKECVTVNILGHLHEDFEVVVASKIENCLKKLSSIHLVSLGDALRAVPQGFDVILCYTAVFAASLNFFRQNETNSITFDVALETLEGTSFNKAIMKICADKFDQDYKRLVSVETVAVMRDINSYIEDLTFTILKKTVDLPDPAKYRMKKVVKEYVIWNQTIREAAISLLPYLFAIQTLQSPQQSWKPHPVQVLSILRILKADHPFDSTYMEVFMDGLGFTPLGNQLLQIGTGEGKSVTLAMTACIFALLGYDVHCSCYSEILSERDKIAFNQLFTVLGLSELRIQYGTFNKLAEGFINQNGDMRERIISVIKTSRVPQSKRSPSRPSILLVDEVDVFLNPSFFCMTYNPIAGLAHPAISELFYFIWTSTKDASFSFDTLKTQKEYQACINAFPHWVFFIERESKEVIEDAFVVRNNQHVAHFWNEKINKVGYKVNDTYSYVRSYGYQTICLYFHECESRKLSTDIALSVASFNVDCGHFLYRQLCDNFAGIFGVTGTLKSLTELQKQSLKDAFSVVTESYIPSAYGERRTRFAFPKNDPKSLQIITTSALFYTAVLNEITTRINHVDGKRTVIAFFETEEKLTAFVDFAKKTLTESGLRVQKMSTGDSPSERNDRIRGAVVPGTVTLAVADYGRGTDFVAYEKGLNDRGGIHVIQTFFSRERTEEIQIQGRTARNTNAGSYSMVLNSEDLTTVYPVLTSQKIEEIINSGKPFDELDQLRLSNCDEALKKLKISDGTIQLHNDSMELREATADKIKQYLKKH
jgi:energy-coupling factor transporter ATP-binding protein EcfA2